MIVMLEANQNSRNVLEKMAMNKKRIDLDGGRELCNSSMYLICMPSKERGAPLFYRINAT